MLEKSYLLGTTSYCSVATGKVEWLDPLPLTADYEIPKTSYPSLMVDEQGFRGSRHYGLTRRNSGQDQLFWAGYKVSKGTMIANNRAWSAITREDLSMIQQKMQSPEIPFGLLRENVGLSGIEFFSKFLPGTLLVFRKRDHVEVILSVFSGNNPCHIPAGIIAQELDFPEAEKMFAKVAQQHRGLVGSVIKAGKVELGQSVDVVVPEVQLDWYKTQRLKWDD